jgi:hypothetical protein
MLGQCRERERERKEREKGERDAGREGGREEGHTHTPIRPDPAGYLMRVKAQVSTAYNTLMPL